MLIGGLSSYLARACVDRTGGVEYSGGGILPRFAGRWPAAILVPATARFVMERAPMKALVFHEHGDLDQLAYTDVPEPVAGPHEALVQVKGVALNHLDLWVR